jgi:hypothetical protein
VTVHDDGDGRDRSAGIQREHVDAVRLRERAARDAHAVTREIQSQEGASERPVAEDPVDVEVGCRRCRRAAVRIR